MNFPGKLPAPSILAIFTFEIGSGSPLPLNYGLIRRLSNDMSSTTDTAGSCCHVVKCFWYDLLINIDFRLCNAQPFGACKLLCISHGPSSCQENFMKYMSLLRSEITDSSGSKNSLN